MKFSMNNRKNLVIFSLILMLGLIGYINYHLNKQALLQTSSELEQYRLTMLEEKGQLSELLNGENKPLGKLETEKDKFIKLEGTEESGKHEVKGAESEPAEVAVVDSRDASYVANMAEETSDLITDTITSKDSMQGSAYFIESKLERDKKRSELLSNLNNIINSEKSSNDTRSQAENLKLQIVTNTEKEVLIENMITAKGFDDALVYLTDSSINVIVGSEKLTEQNVSQIVDIIQRETDIAMDDITIMNKK